MGLVHFEGDFVHALHVRPDQTRTGVGAALMDFAERAMAAAGQTSARLETDTFNARSQAFYGPAATARRIVTPIRSGTAP